MVACGVTNVTVIKVTTTTWLVSGFTAQAKTSASGQQRCDGTGGTKGVYHFLFWREAVVSLNYSSYNANEDIMAEFLSEVSCNVSISLQPLKGGEQRGWSGLML